MQDKIDRTYLPASQVRARYGVSEVSIWRWLQNEALGSPAPIQSVPGATGAGRT